MKKMLTVLLLCGICTLSRAQALRGTPMAWKWVSDTVAVFSYDGSFNDADAFGVDARSLHVLSGVKAPERFTDFPYKPEGAVNLTWSPDSSMIAFTRGNDLFVYDLAADREKRLTFDGSDVILNGYASWVYYEEIFGRASRYCAFWWSPDSKRLGFYRFDNSSVPMFEHAEYPQHIRRRRVLLRSGGQALVEKRRLFHVSSPKNRIVSIIAEGRRG